MIRFFEQIDPFVNIKIVNIIIKTHHVKRCPATMVPDVRELDRNPVVQSPISYVLSCHPRKRYPLRLFSISFNRMPSCSHD